MVTVIKKTCAVYLKSRKQIKEYYYLRITTQYFGIPNQVLFLHLLNLS